MKAWAKVAVGVGATLIAVPSAFATKQRFFPHRYDVVSIATLPDYQAPSTLERAWALPAAAPLKTAFAYQSNPSTCGPTSLADVERSFGVTGATARSVLEGTGKCWTGICLGGLTLEELADIAHAKTRHRATVLRDLTLADFREQMKLSNDPARRYIVNFNRGMLFVVGHGHHSPIGGYLEERDLVFVLDVNDSFKPWLVPTERLFAAMDTRDGMSGKKRGLLLLE